jgi:hypothetical protein
MTEASDSAIDRRLAGIAPITRTAIPIVHGDGDLGHEPDDER